MPDPSDDFWPTEIIDTDDPPPVKLLKEQAVLLGGKTNNAVEGIVKTSTEEGTAYYSLYLRANALGDYLYKLLYIAHPAIGRTGNIYPITVQNSAGGAPIQIEDDDEFREWLRSELSSDYVRRAIGSLLRYIRESRRASHAS
jgi:hypothetical protein